MADESGLNGNINQYGEATASTSQTPVVEMDRKGEQSEEKNKGEKEIINTISFYKLFAFADSKDVMLIVIGSIADVANGVVMPLMTILLGDLVDSFGQSDTKDTVLVVSKVGKFIQLVATFIGGFVIAFIKGWLLTLVMLTSIPPMVVSDAAISIVVSKMASRGQVAYSVAGNVVEQTIGSIRTVSTILY
ncbi:hypothetical protein MKX03_026365 [Papaver bracteatum]|nr:hypothetical protein MKX03_026365 [Papaver bracteatum]